MVPPPSSGAAESVPFVQVTNLARTLRQLQTVHHCYVVGAAGEAEARAVGARHRPAQVGLDEAGLHRPRPVEPRAAQRRRVPSQRPLRRERFGRQRTQGRGGRIGQGPRRRRAQAECMRRAAAVHQQLRAAGALHDRSGQ